jgi:hypothetical protein
MFVGLGDAERRVLLIIRPDVPLTITDAKRIYPETDHRTHRRAMVSLARKGFVQVQPGPVFAIGVACERTTSGGKPLFEAGPNLSSPGRECSLLGTIETVKKPFTIQLPVTPPAIDIHQLQLTLPLV